jgi:NarL family two-component system response regulator LiaR
MPIRVMIVDDHAIVRSGLVRFLGAFQDLEFAGEASSVTQALEMCAVQQPDVILQDIFMPEEDGIAGVRRIRAKYPHIQVLMLSSFDDDKLVAQSLDAGAVGFLLKNTGIQEMANAIRAAHAGKSTLSPEALEALIRTRTGKQTADVGLKEREIQVLELMVEGKSNPEIATALNLSLSTVKFYASNILGKLDSSTRTGAVARALELGLLDKSQ